jgi:hypothetical protein
MKLRKSSKNDQPEIRKAYSIWLNGKDTQTPRTLGYQPKNWPMHRTYYTSLNPNRPLKRGYESYRHKEVLKRGYYHGLHPRHYGYKQTHKQSPKKPPLNLSYSQVAKTNLDPWARDPGKYQVTRSPDQSHDLPIPQRSYDLIACDPGKPLGDLPRDWSPT